jgi:hypothetical protein
MRTLEAIPMVIAIIDTINIEIGINCENIDIFYNFYFISWTDIQQLFIYSLSA